MDKLTKLLSMCKCGVYLEVNAHRDVYQSAEQRIAEWEDRKDFCAMPDVADGVREKMVDTNTIVSVHFYPDTPVSFYLVAHHDLEAALDQAIACIEADRG